MKRLLTAILPLGLLFIAVGAQRLITPTENGPVVSLGDSTVFNSEKPALVAIVTYLSSHPHSDITIVWREDIGGNGISERRVTYKPESLQLVFLCAGQRDVQTGVTITGMQKALDKGDRGSTFASAVAVSRLSLDTNRTRVIVNGSTPDTDRAYF